MRQALQEPFFLELLKLGQAFDGKEDIDDVSPSLRIPWILARIHFMPYC